MSLNLHACAIIACDVFEEELAAFGISGNCKSVVYLEMGLHDQPDVLRKEVQRTIDELEADPGLETILLLYGICGNGLIGIQSSRCQLVLPRAHDCISILMGGPEVHQAFLKEHPAAYFYTPGWMRGKRVPGPDRDAYLRDYYTNKYPEDPELVEDIVEADHETFAHHNCAAYVDITGNATAETYCRKCAASLEWQYRRIEGNSRLLKDFLNGNWNTQRFLVCGPSIPISGVLDSDVLTIQG